MFDGLETLFAQNLFIAVHAILRSLNNRRFIYFVTLKLDYSVLKEQEKKAEEERGRVIIMESDIASPLWFSENDHLSLSRLEASSFVYIVVSLNFTCTTQQSGPVSREDCVNLCAVKYITELLLETKKHTSEYRKVFQY